MGSAIVVLSLAVALARPVSHAPAGRAALVDGSAVAAQTRDSERLFAALDRLAEDEARRGRDTRALERGLWQARSALDYAETQCAAPAACQSPGAGAALRDGDQVLRSTWAAYRRLHPRTVLVFRPLAWLTLGSAKRS